MIDYYVAIAKERGLDLLAEAEAERLATQVRRARGGRRRAFGRRGQRDRAEGGRYRAAASAAPSH